MLQGKMNECVKRYSDIVNSGGGDGKLLEELVNSLKEIKEQDCEDKSIAKFLGDFVNQGFILTQDSANKSTTVLHEIARLGHLPLLELVASSGAFFRFCGETGIQLSATTAVTSEAYGPKIYPIYLCAQEFPSATGITASNREKMLSILEAGGLDKVVNGLGGFLFNDPKELFKAAEEVEGIDLSKSYVLYLIKQANDKKSPLGKMELINANRKSLMDSKNLAEKYQVILSVIRNGSYKKVTESLFWLCIEVGKDLSELVSKEFIDLMIKGLSLNKRDSNAVIPVLDMIFEIGKYNAKQKADLIVGVCNRSGFYRTLAWESFKYYENQSGELAAAIKKAFSGEVDSEPLKSTKLSNEKPKPSPSLRANLTAGLCGLLAAVSVGVAFINIENTDVGFKMLAAASVLGIAEVFYAPTAIMPTALCTAVSLYFGNENSRALVLGLSCATLAVSCIAYKYRDEKATVSI